MQRTLFVPRRRQLLFVAVASLKIAIFKQKCGDKSNCHSSSALCDVYFCYLASCFPVLWLLRCELRIATIRGQQTAAFAYVRMCNTFHATRRIANAQWRADGVLHNDVLVVLIYVCVCIHLVLHMHVCVSFEFINVPMHCGCTNHMCGTALYYFECVACGNTLSVNVETIGV